MAANHKIAIFTETLTPSRPRPHLRTTMPHVQGPAQPRRPARPPGRLPEAKFVAGGLGWRVRPLAGSEAGNKEQHVGNVGSAFKSHARQAWMPWWPRLSPGWVPVIYHPVSETATNNRTILLPVLRCIRVLFRMFRGCPGPGPGPGRLSRFKGIVWIYCPNLTESFLYGEAVNTTAANPETLKHSSAHHGRNPTHTHPRKPQP